MMRVEGRKERAMIKIKRIYLAPSKDDGFRILVDRLWPRGVSKVRAKLDLWLKEIGPSNGLRKWFGHDVKKCGEFRAKYRAELESKQDELAQIKSHAKDNVVTLLYGTKEKACNNATVLREYLENT